MSQHSGDDGDSQSFPPTTKDSDKPLDNDSASSLGRSDGRTREAEEPITWHYLTFETELPAPAYTSQSESSPPPECPNLKPYTSPFLWSKRRKSLMTWLSCAATIFTAYASGAYSSGIDQMAHEWHVSEVAAIVGITTFTCGFGIAPMFLAPFSEINGRRPVFVITGALFVVFQLICAVTPTYAGMVVSRFLAGCASSTFATMVGGVLSDMFLAEDRNDAMALYSGAALAGTGLGPLVSGFIAQHISWRWIFYLQVIIDGVLLVLLALFFKETRGSVLLSRKAKVLNKWYDGLEAAGHYGMILPTAADPQKPTVQRIRWKVKSDEERGTILQMIRISLHRPLHMLVTEPVVFFFSLWISFSWSVLYLTFSAIPLIFETTYHFNLEQSEAVFASITVASVIFTVVAI